jgi:RsiW-degrading membrane proteinase PrsW (M82 family)
MTWSAPEGQAPGPSAGPAGALTRGRSQVLRTGLRVSLTVIGFGVCAAVLVAAIGHEAGVTATLVGLVLAVLPLGVVVPAFLWLDRFEPEPPRLLLLTFLWGALVASTVALVVNTSTMMLLSRAGADAMTIGAIAVAPVVEEVLKASALVVILLLRRREVDSVVDGIVYAGIAAAGFAFAENILYLARAFHDYGGDGLVFTFLLRGVMGPFAHPLFTCCTGLAVGIAVTTHRKVLRVLVPAAGLIIAIALHSFWNLTAAAGASGYVLLYAVLQVPVFLAFVTAAILIRRHEGRVIGRHLVPYADRGWLSPGEVTMLASMRERRRARTWARLGGGRTALTAMEAFQDTASELALLRRRINRGKVDASMLATERLLLDRLMAGRTAFLGHTPY